MSQLCSVGLAQSACRERVTGLMGEGGSFACGGCCDSFLSSTTTRRDVVACGLCKCMRLVSVGLAWWLVGGVN